MDMTTEQKFLIQVLRDFIAKQNTVVPAPVDTDQLIAYAKSQQVSAILYHQCKSIWKGIAPTPAMQSLAQQEAMELFYYANRMKLIGDIDKAFRERGIQYIIVKGIEVAALYPIPALRSMGDTDIVVHPEDMKSADEALMQLGFSHDYSYWKGNLEVELHDCLLEYEGTNTAEYDAYFNDFWPHVENDKLSWDFHFLYLVSHLRKHIMSEGVGLRQFMDLSVVADRMRSQIDWPWVEMQLEQVGLLDFTRIALAFCQRWFGLISPIAVNEITDDFFERVTEKIFLDGVFGHENEENKVTFLAKRAYQQQGNGLMAKLSFILHSVFPGYEALRIVSYYSFVNGKKYLMPVAWIYRLIRIMTGKVDGQRKLDVMRDSLGSDELVQKRVDMLTQWHV